MRIFWTVTRCFLVISLWCFEGVSTDQSSFLWVSCSKKMRNHLLFIHGATLIVLGHVVYTKMYPSEQFDDPFKQ